MRTEDLSNLGAFDDLFTLVQVDHRAVGDDDRDDVIVDVNDGSVLGAAAEVYWA